MNLLQNLSLIKHKIKKSHIIGATILSLIGVFDHYELGYGRRIRRETEHVLNIDSIDDSYYFLSKIEDWNKLGNELSKIDTLTKESYFKLLKALSVNEMIRGEIHKLLIIRKERFNKKNIDFDYKKEYFSSYISKIFFDNGYFINDFISLGMFERTPVAIKINKKVNISSQEFVDLIKLFPGINIKSSIISIGIVEDKSVGLLGCNLFEGSIVLFTQPTEGEFLSSIEPQNKIADYNSFENSVIANEVYHHFFEEIFYNDTQDIKSVVDDKFFHRNIRSGMINEFGSDIATLVKDNRSAWFLFRNYFLYESSNCQINDTDLPKDYELSVLVSGEVYQYLCTKYNISSRDPVKFIKQLSEEQTKDMVNEYLGYYYYYYDLLKKDHDRKLK